MYHIPNTYPCCCVNPDAITQSATAKRERIIAREGDADGARLLPDYYEQLLQEAIQEQAAAAYMERRFFHGRAEGVYPLPQPH